MTVLPQLTFSEALQQAWEKITKSKGRSRRSEYWWTVLAAFIINLVTSFIPFIGNFISIATGIAMIPISIRRLHDTGHSGWWYGVSVLLGCVASGVFLATFYNIMSVNGLSTDVTTPDDAIKMLQALFPPEVIISYIIAFAYNIVILVFTCQDSQPYDNKYGPSPKYKADEPDENVPDYVPEWK